MIEILTAALFGLLAGSFLNVCIHRWPRDLSVVWPGSHCLTCGSGVAWYDNVPLLSYVLLAGRCRSCRARISWRYPVVELLTALFFAASVWKWGPSAPAAKFALFAAMQVGMIFSDLETRLLPDEFTKGGIWIGLAASAAVPLDGGLFETLIYGLGGAVPGERILSLLEAAFAAAATSGALWATGWLFAKVRHKEGLGFGDVKLVAMIGAFLGLGPVLAAILYGSVLSLVAGIAYVLYKRRDMRTYELPYGTFLGIAAIAVALM
jgi:leader peptidase (prepilin peptidase)/N-methyltransferase